jgi:carboxymethylenebutenolidase
MSDTNNGLIEDIIDFNPHWGLRPASASTDSKPSLTNRLPTYPDQCRFQEVQITTTNVELTIDGFPCRTYVATPKPIVPGARYPGIVLYSEIFQLTGPICRTANRLAGHGFVVAAPEIYHRACPPGLVIAYDDPGRMYGNYLAHTTLVQHFDATATAVFDHFGTRADVAFDATGLQLGAIGFCIGGHLALRAALDLRCRAAVCAYPTGLHNGALGSDKDAGTLARLHEIKGEVLLVFGDMDPHVPIPARRIIHTALQASGVRQTYLELHGEHAFMRDEGARYDPQMADRVFEEAIALYRRTFGG